MTDVMFPEGARTVLDECLAHPYRSTSASGELVAEHGENGQPHLVLTEVPTGLDPNELFGQVANDTKKGLVPGLRSIHDESPESGGTRVVFTLAFNTDIEEVARHLRSSFERARPAIEATHARIRAEVAGQGLIVALSWDDWFLVRAILADARARHPQDAGLREAANLVEVSLFGEEVQ